MKDKISKICSYFGGSLYKFIDSPVERDEMAAEVGRRLTESAEVLAQGDRVMRNTLAAAASIYPTWSYAVTKEKMVYDALNMCEFDIKRHVFIAEGWVPVKDYESVVHTLSAATIEAGLDTRPIVNRMESRLTPPTYIPVTKFTSGFQALVNTYGTPRYREANPGAFACILFPFLFGIMFGDFGHGFLLAAFGYWLITKEKEWDGKVLNDMVQMCYGGRYVILLNGIFGCYVGLLYNEAFAFPMNFFGGSRWVDAEDQNEGCSPEASECVMLNNEPYPVGIDPIWHYTANKITFFNSFKMKISIVVGVLQMTCGICLSLLNHLEYKDYKKVFFQFIPEIVFFEGIFGYLVFTIFFKWSTDWADVANGGAKPLPAPSLLTLLINMFMSPTSDIAEPLYGHQCFTSCAVAAPYCATHPSIWDACPVTCNTGEEGADRLQQADVTTGASEFKLCFSEMQSSIQLSLLIAAFVAVPFLLIPIPLIELAEHSKAKKYAALEDSGEEGTAGGHGEHGDEFSFGDAFIHQAIHTIEFVLGSISNTASYLRLWALSLAHSQLAELFKDMILVETGLTMTDNPILGAAIAWFSFAAWAIISMVVLMVMENLSSFLHALRLQWVEFQNKFFYGDGHRYTPFAFSCINQDAGDE
jgi:V-type H+-transporting ATPase subunit a